MGDLLLSLHAARATSGVRPLHCAGVRRAARGAGGRHLERSGAAAPLPAPTNCAHPRGGGAGACSLLHLSNTVALPAAVLQGLQWLPACLPSVCLPSALPPCCCAAGQPADGGNEWQPQLQGTPSPVSASAKDPPYPLLQGDLLMVAMQLMLGGSLRTALLSPNWQDELRWENR